MTQLQLSGLVPEWTRGDRLRKARSLTGLTTHEFADLIGVSHMTINNAETDRRKVRQITINAWAMATGVSRQWLETGAAPTGEGEGQAVRHVGLEPTTRWFAASTAAQGRLPGSPIPLPRPVPTPGDGDDADELGAAA